MKHDESVFIMGEDVGLYGGAYGATRGSLDEFGEWRVIDTPISEATIGGAAVGAAMAGMRPVAEIMYVDFHSLGYGPDRQPGRKEPLHVWRKDQCSDGDSYRRRRRAGHCSAPFPKPGIAVDAFPWHLCCDAIYAL